MEQIPFEWEQDEEEVTLTVHVPRKTRYAQLSIAFEARHVKVSDTRDNAALVDVRKNAAKQLAVERQWKGGGVLRGR